MEDAKDMLRTLCKSKLHRATVTEANVLYTGSLTLDARLMAAADLLPYEQVHVVDVDNGARIVTYCIEGPADSGTVCINGAAARLISAGHTIIVMSYAQLNPEELRGFSPKIVLLDERNAIREVVSRSLFLSGGAAEEDVPAASSRAGSAAPSRSPAEESVIGTPRR